MAKPKPYVEGGKIASIAEAIHAELYRQSQPDDPAKVPEDKRLKLSAKPFVSPYADGACHVEGRVDVAAIETAIFAYLGADADKVAVAAGKAFLGALAIRKSMKNAR